MVMEGNYSGTVESKNMETPTIHFSFNPASYLLGTGPAAGC
jgi:hypothetical protein